MKRHLTIIAATILLFMTMSCKETKDVINTASNVTLDGSYIVTTINGEQTNSEKASLTFNALNKMLSGNTGCNNFSGSYSVDVFALSIGSLKATKMFCEEPAMSLERSCLKALKNTGSYTIKDKQLTLYSKTDRSPILTAKKAK